MANPRNSTFFTAFWVAKMAFLFFGFLSLAGAAKFVVPVAVEILATAFLRLWAAAQPWLAPPYLFITVHLIILVIWKLSDQMQHHQLHAKVVPFEPSSSPAPLTIQRKMSPELWSQILQFSASPALESQVKATPLDFSPPPIQKDPLLELQSKIPSPLLSPMHRNNLKVAPFEPSSPRSPLRMKSPSDKRSTSKSSRSSTKATPFEYSTPSPLRRKPSMDKRSQIPSSAATLASPVHENQAKMSPLEPSCFEIMNNVGEPTSERRFTTVEFNDLASEFENESMEITWNSIMEKSPPTWKPITPLMTVPVEDDSDDLNRRFDEFIKKKYDQMRLESFHRRQAAATAE